MLSHILPFATLVILLVWMGFFMLGSLPLLVLEHDTPLDARFVRGLFDVYYKAVMVTASAAAIAHAVAGRKVTTAMLVAVAVIAWQSSRRILSTMDRLRSATVPMDAPGIREFRKLHVLGMVLNVAQLAAICAALPKVL